MKVFAIERDRGLAEGTTFWFVDEDSTILGITQDIEAMSKKHGLKSVPFRGEDLPEEFRDDTEGNISISLFEKTIPNEQTITAGLNREAFEGTDYDAASMQCVTQLRQELRIHTGCRCGADSGARSRVPNAPAGLPGLIEITSLYMELFSEADWPFIAEQCDLMCPYFINIFQKDEVPPEFIFDRSKGWGEYWKKAETKALNYIKDKYPRPEEAKMLI
jgi:hypothetical protein